jgi:hypothetical protein
MKTLASILCICVLCCASATGDDSAKLVSLQKQITRLEADVQAAEAIRAIKRLQYAYGHYAEFGLWHDLADLFAENGVGHYPAGKLGKEAIRKLFLQEVGKGKLGLAEGMFYPHIMLQPVVTLAPDRKTAKGRFRVLAMLGSYGGAAIWAGGVYENEYILEHSVWKIKELHYYSKYSGRYEQAGWTVDKEAIPIPIDPARAGTPIPSNTNPSSSPDEASPTLAILINRLAKVTRQAQLLNEEAEVETLQNIYGYYVDRKMWDDVADLFATDATMELGLQGVYAGKAGIRRALDQFGPKGLREGELNEHLQLQTIVHVAPDGRTAKARGIELIMSGVNGVGGQWGEGVFENAFIKQNGVWKIQSLRFYPRLLTDYEKGWAKDAKPAPGPNKDFPPDRPPTEVYEIFPKFYIPPFHFANPATGLATRYPEGTNYVGSPRQPKLAADKAPAIRTMAELSKGIAETRQLLNTAAAYIAAENLAGAYGYYLDESMWDETADLFARDGRRRLSNISDDKGRESIRQSIKRRYPGKKTTDFFTAHQLVQPVIHVAQDGQTAKMRVRLFQLGGASGGNGFWLAGVYECQTRIENGMWKFEAMNLDYTWTADYKGGWARVSDKTKGIVVTPFPKIVDLPFHYRNPVTGRKPPVYLE